MRALLTGVTGIRSHQVRMDVIGNNIANVNTVGFKASRVTFSDVLSETISAGSAETSPQQVGLGVGVASTDLLQSPGSLQLTGRSLDLAIEGNGFFVLRRADGQFTYSRAGSFDWNAEGYLVNPGTGQRVQGWVADASGNIDITGPDGLSDIRLARGAVALAAPTTQATFSGNLNASAAVGDTFDTAFTAYDSLGRALSIPVRFTKIADNQWDWEYQDPDTMTFNPGGTLSFNTDGTLPTTPPPEQTITLNPMGADPLNILLRFGEITQASAAQATAASSCGRPTAAPWASWSRSPSRAPGWWWASSPTACAATWRSWPWPASPTRAAC